MGNKFTGGLLIGFFLAVLILSVSTHLYLRPVEDQLETANRLAEEERYESAIEILRSLEELEEIPLIGDSFEFADETASTLEYTAHTSRNVYRAYRYSIPVAALSVLFVFLGAYMAFWNE